MSKVPKRRAAAATETIHPPEKEEDQQEPLDGLIEPEVPGHRAEFQQLLVIKEEVMGSSSLDQEDPPELPRIKEEHEELWTRQEGEKLRGLEEADIKFTFTPVAVKSEEDDEDEPHASQLQQIKTEEIRDLEFWQTESDGEDCGGPEPASDDSWDWEDTRKSHSGLNHLQHNEAPIRDVDCDPGAISVIPSECATTSGHRKHRLEDDEIQTGLRPFGCSVCGKRYRWKNSLRDHKRLHVKEKPFSCSECKKGFQWKLHLVRHMRTHTGEKPFSCSVCGKRFTQHETLKRHSIVHSGEKPYTCSVCGKKLRERCALRIHMTIHARKKRFSCSLCDERFALKQSLRRHLTLHTVEKPFNCLVCGEKFAKKELLKRHSTVHTGETTFSCSVCGKGFALKYNLRQHFKVHTEETT